MTGRVAIGTPDDAGLTEFVGGRPVIDELADPSDRWDLAGAIYAGVVDDDHTHAAALDLALRGADVVAEVATGRIDRFEDDLRRCGIQRWEPARADRPDWAAVLDALAEGVSMEAAATRAHLSLRSAHRRLAQARADLGTSTTTETIAAWIATKHHA